MKAKNIIILLLIVAVLFFVGSVSFAYFASGVAGNTNVDASSTTITQQIGEVEFNGTDTFDTSTLDEIYPGFIGVQTFTIEPYQDGSNIYEIDLAATVPSAFGHDLKITLYKTSNVTNNNIEREEGSLIITDGEYVKQDTLTVNGTLTKVYEATLTTTERSILEQVNFTIENGSFTTPSATPDGFFTYYAVYEYLNNGDQNNQQGLSFSSKITVKYIGEILDHAEETLAYLNTFNSIYSLSDSNKCLTVDANGKITNYSATMSDADTPIVCAMEDDYGTSYYLRGLHTDNNVKFADSCWKIIRVTGSGGIKMIYNGDLDANGKCTTTSGDHTGFTGQTLSLSGNKLYGSSYTKSGSTYTLSDTSTLNWPNDSSSIVGKYTCNSTSSTCSTLYAVTGEYTSSSAYAVKLDQSTNYAQIGKSAFYAGYTSPAYVGYMFNDAYKSNDKNLGNDSSNYYYGSSFSYNANNPRPYTLTNTVQFASISYSWNRTSLDTHHYTCFYSADNTCDELYFIFGLNNSVVYYIKLEGNESIDNVLDKMLRNDDINVKDSHVKGVIDYWYKTNIEGTTYEGYLEDGMFCNDRTIDQLYGWSETGVVSESHALMFNARNDKYYLKCPSKRDAFTVSDTAHGNGALTYPIGLLATTEHVLSGNYNANKTGFNYWVSSPFNFDFYQAFEDNVSAAGAWKNRLYNDIRLGVSSSSGVRPSISLKPGTKFVSGGDGSGANPLVVDVS